MSTLIKVLIFAAGLSVGSAVTYVITKNRYEKEIQSVKEVFSKRESELSSDLEEAREHLTHNAELDEEDTKAMMESFKETVTRLGYTDYTGEKEKEEDKMSNVDRPYVIAPDEYGETGYNTIGLTYYDDGILADDFDDDQVDIEDTVGYEALQHFGEYEDDIVHVRNDSRRCDYEVCLDERRYSDVNPMEG